MAADASLPPDALATVEVTLVDPSSSTYYATFQSHNQKVVANQHGFFMSYLHAYDESGGAYAGVKATVRLARSVDHGTSFATICEWVLATKAPVLETNGAGDLYVISQDWDAGDAIFNTFLASNAFADPTTVRISGGAAGKYAAYLDRARNQIYYMTWNRFFVLDETGNALSSREFLVPGPNASWQYPHLAMSPSAPDSLLFAAWTTAANQDSHYYDIHFLTSWDGGSTWGRPWPGEMVTLPVIADDTGPGVPIVPSEEISTTGERWNWLGNMSYRNGKLHFLYSGMQLDEFRTHYVRYDWNPDNPHVDTRIAPSIAGETLVLSGLDGFFVSGDAPGSPLYLVSHAIGGRVGVLVSHDNGSSWHDFAVSDYAAPSGSNLYAIGGSRRITDDGWIIGSFTEQSAGATHGVYFLRVKTP